MAELWRKQAVGSGRSPKAWTSISAGFGYTYNFALDPFEIRVATANNIHSGLSLKQLSESERFRFSIAFQIALATVTNFRLVVVDRADVSDKASRKLLTSVLVNGDQSIVLATGEEPPLTTIPQGVKFFDLTRLADWEEIISI